MIRTSFEPITIIGLSLTSDRGTAHQFAAGRLPFVAAQEVASSHYVGEWQ